MPDERVLRQLTEALLFERMATWPSERYAPYGGVDRPISFRVGPCTYRCQGRVGAFGRVRVVSGSIRKVTRRRLRETSWWELLEDLPAEASVRATLTEELASTARLCRYDRGLSRLRRSRRNLPYDELESSLHEGHPYHPCFKARTGFSLADHAQYGPEAGNVFGLRWLLVQRDSLHQTLPTAELQHLRAELTPEDFAALERAWLGAAGRADYGVLPVHPWQWRALAGTPAVQAALERRELVDLGLELGRYRASLSLRTLVPVDRPHASHVKLPLNVRISSSWRTLAPETVKTAPAASRWLESLVAGDAFFERVAGALVLAEHASSAYAPRADASELSTQLAVIWRRPVTPALRTGERATPFSALFALERDGRPFVDAWLARHGILAWVGRLLRVTLLPLWRLLSHHGVALESHAQNLILLHEEGWPQRLALRDFHDSLEYVPSFLAEPERAPRWGELDPRFAAAPLGRYYAMSSLVELRDLFIDAVLIFNLTELSWLLERHYGFAERVFWRLARAVLVEHCRSAWGNPEREAQLRPFAPYVHTESLFKARIRTSHGTPLHHVVPNALTEQAEKEIHAEHR